MEFYIVEDEWPAWKRFMAKAAVVIFFSAALVIASGIFT